VKGAFHYPLRALAFDYAGSVSGLACTLGLIVFVRLAAPVAWVMGAAAVLFLVYFGRTVCRQLTHIELDEAGIRARGPLGGAIRWEELRSLRLEYYSTRQDPEGRTMDGGWMELKLRDAQRTIRIDSELEGFVAVVDRAAQAAAQRGLALDAATAGNLESLRP
jgi:hypothetical protein